MKILVLHLSDIHFREGRPNPIITKVEKIRDALQNLEHELAGCIIAVSGDIAFAGLESEYTMAFDFLMELQRLLEGSLDNVTSVQFVFIPGNHDCNFTRSTLAREKMIAAIRQNPAEASDTSIIDLCTSVQDDYFSFLEAFENKKLTGQEKLFYKKSYQFGGQRVLFRCYNTAWISERREQQGKMVFPSSVVKIDQNDVATTVVSMLHHPSNWLENENATSLQEIVEASSDIILTGHEHTSDRFTKTRQQGTINEYLTAGALQQEREPDESSFSAIFLDLAAKKQKLIRFDWSDSLYLESVASDKDWQELQVNQLRRQRHLTINSKFKANLDDPQASFTTARGNLALSDIFVYPTLREVKLDKTHKAYGNGYHKGEELADTLLREPHVVIIGPEDSGKTTLAKVLFQDLTQRGLTPVLLNAEKLDDTRQERIMQTVYTHFEEQYSKVVLDQYRQLPPSKRVLLVDDFHKLPFSQAGRNKILETLEKQFGYLIVFFNNLSIQLESVVQSGKGRNLLNDFSYYQLQPLTHAQRDKLLEKWLRPQDDMTSTPLDLARRVKHTRDILDALFQRRFIPAYPMFVLITLQTGETAFPLNVSASSYGHGYFYEALIMHYLKVATLDVEPGTDLTYLSFFAYQLFKSQAKKVTRKKMDDVHEGYFQTYKRKLPLGNLLAGFYNANILDVTEEFVKFKYPYVYCYFVAKYMADNITKEDVQAYIKEMSQKVYKEDYANILIFLTHLSKHPFIIDTMVDSARTLFAEVTPTDLSSDMEFFNSLNEAVPPRLVYEDQNPDQVREEQAKRLDELATFDDAIDDEELDDAVDDDEVFLGDLNNTLKTIQILGQILRNAPGSIEGIRKLEVAEECYRLGLRLVKSINGFIEQHMDDVTQNFARKTKERKPDTDQDDLVKRISQMILNLSQLFSFSMIARVGYSVGSEKLEETYKDVKAHGDSVAVSLIDLFIKFEYIRGYPLDDLRDLAKKLDDAPNFYAKTVLQMIVRQHLMSYQVRHDMKQQLCHITGIDLRLNTLTSDKKLEK